jgi:hypothetical protein
MSSYIWELCIPLQKAYRDLLSGASMLQLHAYIVIYTPEKVCNRMSPL